MPSSMSKSATIPSQLSSTSAREMTQIQPKTSYLPLKTYKTQQIVADSNENNLKNEKVGDVSARIKLTQEREERRQKSESETSSESESYKNFYFSQILVIGDQFWTNFNGFCGFWMIFDGFCIQSTQFFTIWSGFVWCGSFHRF